LKSLSLQVVERLANEIAERVTASVIARLQSQKSISCGEFPSANRWDEICIKTRTESALIEMYDSAVEAETRNMVATASAVERVAL